jgi:hypothetical protein
MESKRQAALGFVFVTVLLDMVAFGVIAPMFNAESKKSAAGRREWAQ